MPAHRTPRAIAHIADLTPQSGAVLQLITTGGKMTFKKLSDGIPHACLKVFPWDIGYNSQVNKAVIRRTGVKIKIGSAPEIIASAP